MAVLHHAFRCHVTPVFEQDISNLLAAWHAGDRTRISTMALARYAALANREDIHAAFYLGPEGAAPSWLQPHVIGLGLAALVVLAPSFVALPTLSASNDTNHHRLATHLPALGWPADEIDLLVHGQPIEAMLCGYAASAPRLDPGGFRHTGGWIPGGMAKKLGASLDQIASTPPREADNTAIAAWHSLRESSALNDARTMLASVTERDWLITSITH